MRLYLTYRARYTFGILLCHNGWSNLLCTDGGGIVAKTVEGSGPPVIAQQPSTCAPTSPGLPAIRSRIVADTWLWQKQVELVWSGHLIPWQILQQKSAKKLTFSPVLKKSISLEGNQKGIETNFPPENTESSLSNDNLLTKVLWKPLRKIPKQIVRFAENHILKAWLYIFVMNWHDMEK